MSNGTSIRAAFAAGVIVASTLAVAMPAQAADGTTTDHPTVPSGVVVGSFDPSVETVTAGEGRSGRSGDCKDRAFAVVAAMSQSLNGCNVIGATASTQVQYKWYKHQGNANPCIWGKSFNTKHAPTWTSLDCGTGRSKFVPWGNVLGTKKMKGLTGTGWAGVQWQ